MTWIVCKATTGEDGITTVTASTPASDRYGDVVSSPWQLEKYKANPVVVWSHDYSLPPVGRALEVTMEGPNLVAKIQWDDSENNPLGKTVAHQFRTGFLSAVSVGFQPGEAVRRNALDESHPYYAERGSLFRDNELLEISAVPIPANPEALARRGMSDFERRHILEVEETEEGFLVLYARGSDASSEQADEGREEEGYKDEKEEENKSVRQELLRLLRGDEQVQAAIDELAEVRREASHGLEQSVITDIFGFSD